MTSPATGRQDQPDGPPADGERAGDAPTRDPNAPAAATPPAAEAGSPSAECAELLQRVRASGGFQSMSEADRAKMRECRPRGAGPDGRGPGSGEFGGGPRGERRNHGDAEIRPAVVFVADTTGRVQPRRVVLGLNDFDYSEVISGLEPGERVVLISVARMQAQQQEFNNRMRERATGAFTGQAPTGGPGGGGGRGR